MKRTELAAAPLDGGFAVAPASVGGAVRSKLKGNDLLARAIRENPGLFGKLATLHPVLAEFAEQGLPDSVAGVVTLDDVARIAGVAEKRLLAYLNDEADAPSPVGAEAESRPDWVDGFRKARDLPCLDVTADIEAHRDPFSHIMAFVDALGDAPGFALKAPFHPVPLRRVLGARGFASHAEPDPAGGWLVYFRRGRAQEGRSEVSRGGDMGDEAAKEWREGAVIHIDVRSLEPPQPLVAILALLERPDCGDEVVVHHRRDPVFLYPELVERGWEWERVPGEAGEVRLRLTRTAD